MDLNNAKWDKVLEEVSSDDESRSTNRGNKRASTASGGGGGKSESGGCEDPTCTSCSDSALSGLFDQLCPDVAGSLPAVFDSMTNGEMLAKEGGEGSPKHPDNFFIAGAMAGARHSSDRGSDDDDDVHDARAKYMKLREDNSAKEVVSAMAEILEAISGDCPKGFLTGLPGFPTRGGATFVFGRATTKEAAEVGGRGGGGGSSGGDGGGGGGGGGGGRMGKARMMMTPMCLRSSLQRRRREKGAGIEGTRTRTRKIIGPPPLTTRKKSWERSSGSSDSESDEEDGSEGNGNSDDGPPPLLSETDSEGDHPVLTPTGKQPFTSKLDLLCGEFHFARNDEMKEVSQQFWEAMSSSNVTPKCFTDYYTDKVSAGKGYRGPLPPITTANLPIGFAEFAVFIGSADPYQCNYQSPFGFPKGFLEYARAVVKQNRRAVRSGSFKLVTAKDWCGDDEAGAAKAQTLTAEEQKRQAAIEKNGKAAEKVEELASRSEWAGPTRSASGGNERVRGSAKSEGDSSSAVPTKGSSQDKADERDAGRDVQEVSAIDAILAARLAIATGFSKRQEKNSAQEGLERQMRKSLDVLERAFKKQEERKEEELAAHRTALAEAEEKTAAALLAACTAEAAAAAADTRAGEGFSGGGVRRASLTVEEAIKRAEALKMRANMVLTDTRYPEAVEQYTLAIKVLEPHVTRAPSGLRADHEEEDKKKKKASGKGKADGAGDQERRVGGEDEAKEQEDGVEVAARELLLILLCNRSLAHLKWGNLGSAKQDAQSAMDLDPHHIKAYFRRAAAHKQAERYREALSDLRYMLRLEPPPVKGVPVSDDILAVQKMAKECEQKLRARGFKKALQETTTSAKPALSASAQKEAKDKWDAQRQEKDGCCKGGSARAMPVPKKGNHTAMWDEGELYLPPGSKIRPLEQLAAAAAAESIDRAPEIYVHWCEGLLSEYVGLVFERLNCVALQTMLKSGIYDKVATISSNAQAEHWQTQDQDYRRMYAAVKHEDFVQALEAWNANGGTEGHMLPPSVLNPHLGLVDVLGNHTLFTYQALDAEEEATPKLFNFNSLRSTGRAVVGPDEFLQQFNVFTEGQLQYLDWNNVVAAGGSVLAATRPPPPGPLRDFYHTLAYRSSDVDLFVYGLDETEATEKVRQIYAAVKRANSKVFAVRSLRAITLVSEFPYRKVQIVLRLYKTLAEVLHGFDVDACSVGFDGHTVWATNRASRAICKNYNVVDLSRRSPSYENRLFKYGKRGYAVFVRELEVDRIKPSLGIDHVNSLSAERGTGLAKMIALDSSYRSFHLSQFDSYFQRWNEGLLPSAGDLSESERIHYQESALEADYTTMYIPYGPKWCCDRTRRHVVNYIAKSNSYYYRMVICSPAQANIEPVVYGDIDRVLARGVNTGERERTAYSNDEETSLMHMKHVTGDHMWLTENPGSQGLLTGSFHPMNCCQKDWEGGAYV